MFANHKSFCRFAKDERGTIIIMLAIALPLIVGLLGLAIDTANWYYAERRVQTATDAAAISGAITLLQLKNDIDAEDASLDSANRNDFQPGNGRTLEYFSPPSSGPFTSDLSAVEIISTEAQSIYFADILYNGSATVTTRAVATAKDIPGVHCVLGLGTDIDGAVEFTGNADFDMGCGTASNSQTDRSMEIWGNAKANAAPMTAAGDIALGGSASLEPANQLLYTWNLAVEDPYGSEGLDLQVPNSPHNCTYNNLHIDGMTTTLASGRYCGGLKITDSTVTFLAGEHIIDGGDFDVSGTSTLLGDEVVFILTGSGSKYATVKFAGGTTADLTAPTSGPYEGVVFFGDPAAPSYKGNNLISNDFLGGSDMNIVGAIYDPAREVVFTGGLGLSGSCLQIVAFKVTLTGSGAINRDCPSDIDLPDIVAQQVKLVE